MNADFETELAAAPGAYRRTASDEALNDRLAAHLLWLAKPGDALLVSQSNHALQHEADKRAVELLTTPDAHARSISQSARTFTPWGWTPSAVALGESVKAKFDHAPLKTVRAVNSKLWSHRLEQELGVALPGATAASTFDELAEAVALNCPKPNDKWVIKSPFGYAARGRVLGRGRLIEEPQAKWSRKRLAAGETLIFQPWLDVRREYGVVLEIDEAGAVELRGVSDLQTNGAGTGKGYILGRPPEAARLKELEEVARIVCARLYAEGYYGAVGIDALEHAGGLHPLLEVNARYTTGFVALAVERHLKPAQPVFWSTKQTTD